MSDVARLPKWTEYAAEHGIELDPWGDLVAAAV